ncbi:restriction endonuclease subunit S [Cronobacter sakazakii]|uniref:restriction endonuclease subunit S n=1 Tax=Cronobacter sakazakii TaxID=28141 RepID=UPI000CFDDCE2|nr:restriction endonuclease subunit S [Cronobacter sakazakii]MDT3520968.1 restriction endonuclease subunit S [Cronobacter sakazakii]
MSFEWRVMTLNQAGVVLIDCDHKTPKAVGSGQPYIGIPQLKNGRITLEGARLISSEDFTHWRRKALPMPNDVILSRRCNPGETAYVPEGLNIALGQNLVLLRATNENVYPPFLRWLTQGPAWWTQVNSFINVGAVFDSLKCVDIPKFLVNLPPYKEQIRISEILCTLDDKIQINEQVNQTLEQMAQALFKSWFVDFEPVKAKMSVLEAGGSQEDATLAAMTAISGKDANALAVFEREQPEQYAELKATAELFPSAMQDSELGEIPEGWELKSFGDVSKCYDKKRIPLSKPQREKKKGEIPYYGATSIMDYVDEYIFDGIYLLLGEDGSVIKENGLPFTQYIWGKSWVNNHAHVLTGSGSVTTEHLMVFIKQENIAAYVTGAVQMKLNQKNMNSIPFIFADEAVNNVFGQRIDSIYAVIRAKSEENLTLTNLRDTLLPKLLSGEITLPEAEQIISEEA